VNRATSAALPAMLLLVVAVAEFAEGQFHVIA
jgi:hypothetical protein